MQVPHPSRAIKFLLDECLSYKIADSLREVEFNITSSRGEGVDGWEDAQLIPWLGQESLVWITKDDSARHQHRALIHRAGISVVWVRGTERTDGTTTRNTISLRELLHLLVARLDFIRDQIAGANGPRFFLLHMRANAPSVSVFTNLDDVGHHLGRGGRSRR